MVATEVRNLAQRSAAAAKDIKSLIGNSVEKVQAGSVLVDESAKALTDIIQSIKSVTDIVAEISAANQEQSSGIEQVNRAVMQMDTVTQQNAALVEEAAAAARAMQEQAASLIQQVGYFHEAVAASAPKTIDADLRKLPVSRSRSSRPTLTSPRKTLVAAGAAAGEAGVWQEF